MTPIVVCSLLVAAQAPPAPMPPGQPAEVLYRLEKYVEAASEKPDELDATLARHPDVQIAEAELRLAQAKLVKAKQLAAQAVTATRGRMGKAKGRLAEVEAALKAGREAVQAKVTPVPSIESLLQSLEAAKAEVAAAEADLKAATGGWQVQSSDRRVQGVILNERYAELPNADHPRPVAAGPAADKLRTALAARVTLDLPADATLHAAAEGIGKAPGFAPLVIRTPGMFSNVGGQFWKTPPAVGPLTGERTVEQWTQVVADAFTESVNLLPLGLPGQPPTRRGRYDFFVRDYGLLLAPAAEAPAGAETVSQFVQRAAAEQQTQAREQADTAKKPSAEVLAKVKAALGKTVKLPEMKGQKPQAVYQALAAGAGLDLAIEVQAYPEGESLTVEAGERTLSAWIELLVDQHDQGLDAEDRAVICVREYGLLVTRAGRVPPGAVPLSAVK